MKRVFTSIVSLTALLLVTMVCAISLLRDYRRPIPPLDAPFAPTPASIRVEAVARNSEPAERKIIESSFAVATICGISSVSADHYEARNDALRSIARNCKLSQSDLSALLAYVASTNDVLRIERTAALKNDVLNLLRNQEKPVDGLAELLIDMCHSSEHPAEVVDYCIQHLGDLHNAASDAKQRAAVYTTLVEAARKRHIDYSGTALYAIMQSDALTPSQEAELKRLTLDICKPDANQNARIAAIQVAGEKQYREVLPTLRDALANQRSDAVVEIVSIGTIGLLGDESDIPLLESVLQRNRRRYEVGVNAAIKRIKDRKADYNVGKQ